MPDRLWPDRVPGLAVRRRRRPARTRTSTAGPTWFQCQPVEPGLVVTSARGGTRRPHTVVSSTIRRLRRPRAPCRLTCGSRLGLDTPAAVRGGHPRVLVVHAADGPTTSARSPCTVHRWRRRCPNGGFAGARNPATLATTGGRRGVADLRGLCNDCFSASLLPMFPPEPG